MNKFGNLALLAVEISFEEISKSGRSLGRMMLRSLVASSFPGHALRGRELDPVICVTTLRPAIYAFGASCVMRRTIAVTRM